MRWVAVGEEAQWAALAQAYPGRVHVSQPPQRVAQLGLCSAETLSRLPPSVLAVVVDTGFLTRVPVHRRPHHVHAVWCDVVRAPPAPLLVTKKQKGVGKAVG